MKIPKQKQDASTRLLTNGLQVEPTHDEIAHRAYSIWEQHGRPQNEEVEIWLLAEAQIREAKSQHAIQA